MPAAAIIQGDQPSVLAVDEIDHVQRRPVDLGMASANLEEVTQGLELGEGVNGAPVVVGA